MVSGTVLMYQTMLLSYWDIHYYLQSSDVSEELKNISPTIKVWEMMTETEAVLRSTQLLFMNLQASTPPPPPPPPPPQVAVSPILVCFAQLQLPTQCSDLVHNIVSINPHNQP